MNQHVSDFKLTGDGLTASSIDTENPVLQTTRPACILIVEVSGHDVLARKIGDRESQRAVKQLLQRTERSVEANHGKVFESADDRILASFDSSDQALIAARDIRKRTRRLPPVSGVTLSLRTGIHSGVIDSEHLDPNSSVLSTAEKLVKAVEPGQILLSSDTLRKLSSYTRNMVAGGARQLAGLEAPAYEMASEEAMTIMQLAPVAPHKTTRLLVRHRGIAYLVNETRPILLLGREEGNDIMVVDRRASRHHARIEYRQGSYFLVDASTNGTCMLTDADEEIRLRRNEAMLPTHGKIGCGFSPSDKEEETIEFEIGDRISDAS